MTVDVVTFRKRTQEFIALDEGGRVVAGLGAEVGPGAGPAVQWMCQVAGIKFIDLMAGRDEGGSDND